MNPLRQESHLKSEFPSLSSCPRSTPPFPVKLSVATLQAEIPLSDNATDKDDAKPVADHAENATLLEEFWEA